jgi:hypothetical protein
MASPQLCTPKNDANAALHLIEPLRVQVAGHLDVVTPADDGRANARVVKAFPNGDGEDLWTRWFLTMRTGRKSDEIRAAGRVMVEGQRVAIDVTQGQKGPEAAGLRLI